MSEVVVKQATPEEAKAITAEIRKGLNNLWDLVTEAWKKRVWVPLGYPSWDEYVDAEFGASRIKIPLHERTEVVGSLRAAGMSIRAIASATGNSVGTVQAASKQVFKNEHVTGTDGKTYSATRPKTRPVVAAETSGEPAEGGDAGEVVDAELVDDEHTVVVGVNEQGVRRYSLTEKFHKAEALIESIRQDAAHNPDLRGMADSYLHDLIRKATDARGDIEKWLAR